jgi:mannitol-1-/sugar-/sorbitol-6-phosphatase
VLPGRVSAILFDLDGVLVDSGQLVEQTWRHWARQRGVPEADVLAVAHGRPARDVVRTFAPALEVETEVLRISGYEMARADEVSAVPGAHECIDIARRGRWGIVTSGARDVAVGRLAAAALPVPEVLITADDVTVGKPSPEPYQRACGELHVPANECLVIEDAPAGVTAGKSAGMTVFAVATTHAEELLFEADQVFSSMDAVSVRLQEIDSHG